MPGDPDVAHQPDERILVERLFQCTRIYADALYRLAHIAPER
jgi:succinyl-diaminopimelate desuccinylase